MSYEQDGQWKKAEADLQAALAFQPDHPYVLNYLGYAWADQGTHLQEALEMIEKAVELRPGDGYITDSLGWVYYRMGRYKDAVPYLEQAVELMPYDPTINDHLGDAYWKVGRRLEAEFQWRRAKNHAEDETLILAIEQKLVDGLEDERVKHAGAGTNETPETGQTVHEEAQATDIQ
jgi:tetratricopeptide (TPR) repeat protein